jgi:hypothetical protein
MMGGMTPKKFRSLALALPEAHEEPHFERASFRVGKKIFATLTADGAQAMVRVRPYERIDALLKTYPDAFFSHGGWTERNGALGVVLKKADEAILKELLTDSWRSVAPKRAQTSH